MGMIELDGAQGEGGGQILRTALTLSMITGTPFRIERIRARRAKPGLLRQHLTAILAAQEISRAAVSGAAPGSLTLEFRPGPIRGGDYRFAIGTAGSCTLVLQTILPALWFADAPSTLRVSGGTHNPAAPPADFLVRSWLPLMHRMGARSEIELLRHGFHPAGGGQIRARVDPVGALRPLILDSPGAIAAATATALVAGLPDEVARRELARLQARIADVEPRLRVLSAQEGPGNVLMLELAGARATALFTGFGARGLPAETVADRVAEAAALFRASGAAVEEHLADQLLLPMALAGASGFSTTRASSHLLTNCDVIAKFLGGHFALDEVDGLARLRTP